MKKTIDNDMLNAMVSALLPAMIEPSGLVDFDILISDEYDLCNNEFRMINGVPTLAGRRVFHAKISEPFLLRPTTHKASRRSDGKNMTIIMCSPEPEEISKVDNNMRQIGFVPKFGSYADHGVILWKVVRT